MSIMPKYWQKYDVDMLQIQSSQGLCCCLSATLPLKPISMSMGCAAAAWNHGDVHGPCCHHGPGLYEWPFQPPGVHSMYCLLSRDMSGSMIPLQLGVILMTMFCTATRDHAYWDWWNMLTPRTIWRWVVHVDARNHVDFPDSCYHWL